MSSPDPGNGIVRYFGRRSVDKPKIPGETGEIVELFGRVPFTVSQVHGNKILELKKEKGVSYRPKEVEADGIITDINRFPVAVYTADCLPILIHDPGQGVVGAIHAGWRSSVARIVNVAVEKMSASFSSDPADLKVFLGPSIQSCCFEVGTEVIEAVYAGFPGDDSLSGLRGGKGQMDLKRFNMNLLRKKGVVNIHAVDLCTCCNHELFYSYRRDGRTENRMINAIMLDY